MAISGRPILDDFDDPVQALTDGIGQGSVDEGQDVDEVSTQCADERAQCGNATAQGSGHPGPEKLLCRGPIAVCPEVLKLVLEHPGAVDAAFVRQDVLRWLQGRGVGYAIKVPFYRWLDLQRYIRDSPTWVPVAPGVTGFAVPGAETPWHIPVTVTIYRKKVHHRATKNYQLDLFDPNDGHYEYSAVTSNLALTVRNLWYFACGRGNHEKTIAQLKTGLAFHSVPTQTYAANSAWQQLVVLAHNLLTNFQLETGAPPRRRTRKHTVVPLLQSVQTLRFELFHRAALLVRPGGKTRLRMTDNLPTRQTFTRIANALASG